jgi:hypothetical protein
MADTLADLTIGGPTRKGVCRGLPRISASHAGAQTESIAKKFRAVYIFCY